MTFLLLSRSSPSLPFYCPSSFPVFMDEAGVCLLVMAALGMDVWPEVRRHMTVVVELAADVHVAQEQEDA